MDKNSKARFSSVLIIPKTKTNTAKIKPFLTYVNSTKCFLKKRQAKENTMLPAKTASITPGEISVMAIPKVVPLAGERPISKAITKKMEISPASESLKSILRTQIDLICLLDKGRSSVIIFFNLLNFLSDGSNKLTSLRTQPICDDKLLQA